jgi:multiple sugar transport system permease protein
VPRDQYEAAALDGANGPQRVRYVTVPHMGPVLLFAIITGVIAALQYFTEAAVASSVASGKTGVSVQLSQVLGYPSDSLLTYTEWLYVRGFSNFQLGYAAALAVLLFVITAAFLFVLLRRFKAFAPEGRS